LRRHPAQITYRRRRVRNAFENTDPRSSWTHIGYLSRFNLERHLQLSFVDLATVYAAHRCTSMASLRVSAFLDPSYRPQATLVHHCPRLPEQGIFLVAQCDNFVDLQICCRLISVANTGR
jgi:hypothetical protein